MARKGTPGIDYPVDPRTQPRDDSYLIERFEEARGARRPFEADWWLNLAYTSGEQSVAYVPQTNSIVPVELPAPFSDMTVHNAIMPIVRQERAKIHKTGVYSKVLPSKDTDEAHSSAKICEAFLKAQLRRWVFQRRLREASFWVVTCGNVLFHWYWDAAAKAPAVEVVPPFEIYPDPHARTFDDSRWTIRERVVSEEEAWDLFADVKGADMRPIRTSSQSALTPFEHRIYHEAQGFGKLNLEGVCLREYYQKPTASNPMGEYIVHTEHGIIYSHRAERKEYPYRHGQLPFTHAGHIERTSSKWHAAVVDFLRGPQDALNRREALIEENINVSSAGKWFLPHTLELDEEIDSMPRQILKATGGQPGLRPEFIQPNALDAWVVQDTQRVESFMRDIAGQHEVSRGGVPGRVESGQAIQLLQEQDDSVMKDTIHSIEEALIAGFRQTLSNAREFGEDETFLRVYDQHGTVEVMAFKRRNIDLDTEIDVKITTSLPTTIAGRFDRVMNLVQYEIVTPVEARNLLELSTEDPDLDPDITARRRQHEEILEMVATGKPILPEQHQNHAAEIDELKKWLNSEAAKHADPGILDLLKAHLHVHEQLELVEAEKAGQLQRVVQGEPLAMVLQQAAGPPGAPPTDPVAAPADPGAPAPPDGQGPPEVAGGPAA